MHKLALSTLAFLVGAAASLGDRAAWADYPERPVRIVVGFGPGSAADVAARIVAEELSQTMRQRFFIENKPGAGSNTAAVGVAKGEADGYTLFLGSAANAIGASVKASSVDLKNDLKPIALLCSLPNILVVHSSVKATTVQDLIALATERNPESSIMALLGLVPHCICRWNCSRTWLASTSYTCPTPALHRPCRISSPAGCT